MRGLSLSIRKYGPGMADSCYIWFFVAMYLKLILEEMIMDWNFLFFMNSALLGVGLAMDAFSVSEIHSVDRVDPASVYRRKYDQGIHAR